jgi:outer membrane protein assembly factor BamB
LFRNGFAVGIVVLFIASSVIPMTLGHNVGISEHKTIAEKYSFDRYLYPEYYDCYNIDEIPDFIEQPNSDTSTDYYSSDSVLSNQKELVQLLDGPMDSPWPMYCHDTHHTGRSPYSTISNMGFEKWRFDLIESAKGSPVIDNNDDIYIGASHLFAIYPNGTLKWEYNEWIETVSAPAIDEDGVLYVGSIWAMPNYLYAIYTSNGTLKWKYQTGNHIYSSPATDDGGTIYFGSEDDYIYALYPNGTLKWKYLTGVAVLSSPAIGSDGTVYCGSHDTYLYALYPNNGTLKWKYKTGHWIRTAPCIAEDGTIYVVSLDNYLHAVNPDGTQKWITNMGEGGTSPTIGQDGTVYAGYRTLHAVDPMNGSVKWTFDIDGTLRGGTPCNSVDGTIYVGTSDGGELIAINPDGTLKWRKSIGTCESAPAIGSDGTVYVGAGGDDGYLYAFGCPDPNAPDTPTINGPIKGKIRTPYNYTFTTIDPNGDNVFYYIDWGDGKNTGYIGPYQSGELITKNHIWTKKGTYVIQAQAKDINDLKSDWGKLTVTIPKNKAVNFNSLLLKLLGRFPILQKLLQRFELQ